MKLEIAGKNREVNITKKRIKNMILRVEKDGTLRVSCPYGVSQKEIELFIRQKESWIVKTMQSQQKQIEKCMFGQNGTNANWLGEIYKIQIEKATRSKLIVDEENKIMTYYLREEDDQEKMKKLFYTTASKRLILVLQDLRIQWDSKICQKYHIFLPSITIKYMTSRWGSCTPTKNHISISSRLIHFPLETIDYVLLHEYVHFLVQNHSKEFYDWVQYYMPQYKVYSNLLK